MMNPKLIRGKTQFHKKEKGILDQIVQLFPLNYKNKIKKLIYYINKFDIISWNKNMEMVYKGKVIQNSNIVKLLYHAVKETKKNSQGMKIFYKALAEIKVPLKMIENKYGQELLTQKELKWKPPGIRNKS